jgi:hypothetical protein
MSNSIALALSSLPMAAASASKPIMAHCLSHHAQLDKHSAVIEKKCGELALPACVGVGLLTQQAVQGGAEADAAMAAISMALIAWLAASQLLLSRPSPRMKELFLINSRQGRGQPAMCFFVVLNALFAVMSLMHKDSQMSGGLYLMAAMASFGTLQLLRHGAGTMVEVAAPAKSEKAARSRRQRVAPSQ